MKTSEIEFSTTRVALAPLLRKYTDGVDVRFWWLGQAGIALNYKSTQILIDPYLSDSLSEKYRDSEFKHLRMMPVPVAPEKIQGCKWCLCTHSHTDHMDPVTIRRLTQSSSPRFLVPRAEIECGIQRGMPTNKVHGINAGETLNLDDGIIVEAIASAHEHLEMDKQGDHKYLGYVIQLGKLRLYHSGDCIPYPGLARQLADRHIDVAFLPINGRDETRRAKGVPGNFTLDEAMELCRTTGVGQLVCHHFEMFDFNTIDRNEARKALQQRAGTLAWLLPKTHVTYTIKPISTRNGMR